MGPARKVGRQARVTAHAALQSRPDAEVERRTVPLLAGAIENSLAVVVEFAVVALVAAEIVILFAGVVARYVFDAPLVWSDELASTLFLWLAMLGAVVALRRGEHMRMTAIGVLAAPTRAVLDSFATAAGLAFLLLIMWPSCQYAVDQLPIT